MRIAAALVCAVSMALVSTVSSFSPAVSSVKHRRRISFPDRLSMDDKATCSRWMQHRHGCTTTTCTHLSSSKNDSDTPSFLNGITITSIPFALAWIGFLVFAYYMSNAEAPGASAEIVNKFIEDPVHPQLNTLFASVFNLLGLIPIPMACLLMPGSSQQKLPAVPFLAASAFGGYGALGPYMMTRTPTTDTSVSKSELGWVTANILENKIFNTLFVATVLSTFFVTGLVDGLLTDPSSVLEGYVNLFQNTAVASASSMDLVILTVTAATLIPEDLARRGVVDANKARAIAASTMLLPVAGSAIYCALRPSLKE